MTKQTHNVEATTMIGTTENGTIITTPITEVVSSPVAPQIQVTRDYSRFSFVKGNRRVKPKKLKRLKESIKQINVCHLYPIMVNSNHAILDGQHRYIACVDLRLPIFYVVVDNVDLTSVALINANQDQWKWFDYLDTYCELDLHDYKVFKGFMRRYDMNFSTTMIMLFGRFTHILYEKFKDGTLTLNDVSLERANEWASRVQSLKGDFSFYKDRGFVLALTTMWKHEDYNHKLFMKKVKAAGSKVVKCTTRLDYLRLLEGLYNWKSRRGPKVRFF